MTRSFLRSGAMVLGLGLASAGAYTAMPPLTNVEAAPVHSVAAAAPVSGPGRVVTEGFADVVAKVTPAVVTIRVESKATPQMTQFPQFPEGSPFGDLFGQRGRGGRQMPLPPQRGLGSGVIVSQDGYILTNNHVVHGADVIKVVLNDRREFTAKVVGTDPQSDLAVVKIDAKDLPAVTFADSSNVEVGDRVLALGNPFGLGQTVTSGMVSALGRATLGLEYQDFIQTDAAINPGNSGGALVDVKGRLVGINTAILSRSGGFQGIGFAIPSDLARSVMKQLVSSGKVVRGYLGVQIQDIDPELADAFKLQDRSGAIVAEGVPGAPAAKAGLKSGDVITEFDGEKVVDGRRLKLAVAEVRPGKDVTVKVLREGKPVEIKVAVGELPGKGASASRSDSGQLDSDEGTLNGVGVGDLDPQMRREFDIPSKVQGVLVTEVEPSSKAAEAGLQPGDVIQEINQQTVRTADDAIRMTENPESKKTLLRIWSRGGTRYLVVDETE